MIFLTNTTFHVEQIKHPVLRACPRRRYHVDLRRVRWHVLRFAHHVSVTSDVDIVEKKSASQPETKHLLLLSVPPHSAGSRYMLITQEIDSTAPFAPCAMWNI